MERRRRPTVSLAWNAVGNVPEPALAPRWADRREKRRDGQTQPGPLCRSVGSSKRTEGTSAASISRPSSGLATSTSSAPPVAARRRCCCDCSPRTAQGRSIAVVDLRGDLFDRILEIIAAAKPQPNPSTITLLDLRDPGRIVGFNPLSGAGEPHSRAYLVLDAIKSHADSWGIQLDETLRNSLIALAEANLSLIELEPLLTDDLFRLKVLQQSTDPSVHAFFERYGALSPERRQSWYLPVLNKVTPLLGMPRLRLLFGAPNPLDLSSILDRPGSVLLVSLAVDRFTRPPGWSGAF
jgi:hypothetical protein